MIDRAFVGLKSPPHTVEVEKGHLRFFAAAIGETNALYTDEEAAKALGYRALPAPPTFAFTLNLVNPNPNGNFRRMNVDLRKVLHGEQKFEYFAPICAGDRITLCNEVVDIYARKGGALEFIVQKTSATNQHGELVVAMTSVTVVRN